MKRIIEWGKEVVYHFLAYVAAGIVVGNLLTCAAKHRDKAEAKDGLEQSRPSGHVTKQNKTERKDPYEDTRK